MKTEILRDYDAPPRAALTATTRISVNGTARHPRFLFAGQPTALRVRLAAIKGLVRRRLFPVTASAAQKSNWANSAGRRPLSR